jgi:hypothetical protein
MLTAFIVLTLLRYLSYQLVSSLKGEMRMKTFAYHVSFFSSSVLETLWAVGVSLLVGISLSPIVHKKTSCPTFFIRLLRHLELLKFKKIIYKQAVT